MPLHHFSSIPGIRCTLYAVLGVQCIVCLCWNDSCTLTFNPLSFDHCRLLLGVYRYSTVDTFTFTLSLPNNHYVSFHFCVCVCVCAHTNPCPAISTIHVILLYFRLCNSQFILSRVLCSPIFAPFVSLSRSVLVLCTLCISGAIANDVVNTFYVDVNILNCWFVFLSKHIDWIDIMEWSCQTKASTMKNENRRNVLKQ